MSILIGIMKVDLSDVAARLATPGAIDALPVEPEAGHSRRWALLRRDDEMEAWIIAWPSGTGLGLHDHDGSGAGIHIVAGRLRERFVGADGELAVRWWPAGYRFDLPGDHVHEVVNVDIDEAVSIHVYSPPVGDVRFREDVAVGPYSAHSVAEQPTERPGHDGRTNDVTLTG